jgi:hypothetical protein
MDRLDSARHKACKNDLKFTLTLREWLSVISDFKGLCAWCQEYTYSIIEMVELSKGLVYDNVVPSCKACSTRRREGYGTAEHRVKQYLSSDRAPQDIAQNEEP